MSAVPHEIWAKARIVFDNLPLESEDDSIDAIALAVLAERERCVKIVQAFRETTTEGRSELIAAIRQQGEEP